MYLNYFKFNSDSVNVEGHDQSSIKYIHNKILNESNFYKNMILKLSDVDKIIKIIQQPAEV